MNMNDAFKDDENDSHDDYPEVEISYKGNGTEILQCNVTCALRERIYIASTNFLPVSLHGTTTL